MMKKFLAIGSLLLWAATGVPCLFAGELYTWTDEKGSLHITDTPPPDSARTVDTFRYTPRPDRDLNAVQKLREHERQSRRLEEAELRVKNAFQQAGEARKSAEDAQQAFEQAQAKTEEMLQKSTGRKKNLLEVGRQKEMEARAFSLAQEAWRQAATADALAREAQDQFDLLQKALREK